MQMLEDLSLCIVAMRTLVKLILDDPVGAAFFSKDQNLVATWTLVFSTLASPHQRYDSNDFSSGDVDYCREAMLLLDDIIFHPRMKKSFKEHVTQNVKQLKQILLNLSESIPTRLQLQSLLVILIDNQICNRDVLEFVLEKKMLQNSTFSGVEKICKFITTVVHFNFSHILRKILLIDSDAVNLENPAMFFSHMRQQLFIPQFLSLSQLLWHILA
ncbi:hypothetical protein BJ742DRAFT_357039 [Cladochytrium replicatum]|nr:hypothetical protein BJ742DRAFT_357039 [Cladochytrium replicatum]